MTMQVHHAPAHRTWLFIWAFCLFLTPMLGSSQAGYRFTDIEMKQGFQYHDYALDDAGHVYWSDTIVNSYEKGDRIWRATPGNPDAEVWAGSGKRYVADGQGTNASFSLIVKMTTDCNGNLFVVDDEWHGLDYSTAAHDFYLRRVSTDGTVTTLRKIGSIAGGGRFTGITIVGCPPTSVCLVDTKGVLLNVPLDDGGTHATLATDLVDPQSIVYAKELNAVLVAETGNDRILAIGLDGTVTPLATVTNPTSLAWTSPLLLITANGVVQGLEITPGTPPGAPPITHAVPVSLTRPSGKPPGVTSFASVAANGNGVAAIQGGDTDPFYGLFLLLPFQVTTPPASMKIASGYPATFSVGVATNFSKALHFQWLRNGAPIVGETNKTLTIANVQPGSAGIYSVAIGLSPSNANLPDILSAGAALEVAPPFVWSTLQQSLPLGYAQGAAVRSNVVYFATLNRIRALTVDGASWIPSVLAGSATYGFADGPGDTALFSAPSGLAVDGATNIFVADSGNNLIRVVRPAGAGWEVSTLAGSRAGGYADGLGTNALFSQPMGLARDTAGNLYVGDFGNRVVRKLTPMGTDWMVTTLAGNPGVAGSTDGMGTDATFNAPTGVAVDAAGNVFVADQSNNLVRRITPSGVVTTIAGLARTRGSTDGLGSAARFNGPDGITVDCAGTLFVSDYVNNSIRQLVPSGTNWMVTTIGGSPRIFGLADGAGIDAWFWNPGGLATDCSGNLYLVDQQNSAIRMGRPAAAATTIDTQSPSQAVLAGAGMTLTVAASNSSLLAYQWLFNGAALPGKTSSSLSLTDLGRTNAGLYQLLVTGSDGAVISSGTLIRVLVPPVLEPPQIIERDAGVRIPFGDLDGGLPDDLSKVALQWRSALPVGVDTNWQSWSSGFYLTNGLVGFDDTNAPSASRVYRVIKN